MSALEEPSGGSTAAALLPVESKVMPQPPSPPPSFVELLKFTVCAMPIYVSPTLLSLIDTATVGQVSAVQLAAMGPACAICDAITGLMVFISVGTTNAVSTAVGGGDLHAAKRATTVAVTASFAIGCVVALLLALGIGPAVGRFALPSAVASTVARTGGDAAAVLATRQLWASAVAYVRIRALSFPATLVLMASQAACLGAKDSRAPTVATLVASTVNVVGDLILVRGPLSLGIAGAAWATVGCQAVAAALLLATLRRKRLLSGREMRRVPSGAEWRRFFAFGAFIFVLLSKQIVYNQAGARPAAARDREGAHCASSLPREHPTHPLRTPYAPPTPPTPLTEP